MTQRSHKHVLLNKYQVKKTTRLHIEQNNKKFFIYLRLKNEQTGYCQHGILAGTNGKIRQWSSLDNLYKFIRKNLPGIKNLEIDLHK